jgi:hypothetical protein
MFSKGGHRLRHREKAVRHPHGADREHIA